jgi:uncharacterized protein
MSDTTPGNYPSVAESFGIVGILILAMIVFVPVNMVLDDVAGKEISTFVYYTLSMGFSFWIVDRTRRKRSGESVYSFGISSAKVIALVSIAVLGIQTGIVSPIVSLIPMPEFVKDLFLELSRQTGIFSFITIAIAAPVLEELIFRGVILDGLLKRHSPLKSILISSILFGIVHLNPWQFVTALAIGSLSGWVYYKTHNLMLCIVIHFVNNFAAFISMRFTDAEAMMNSELTDYYGGLINLILIISGSLLIVVCSLVMLKDEFQKSEINSVGEPEEETENNETSAEKKDLL